MRVMSEALNVIRHKRCPNIPFIITQTMYVEQIPIVTIPQKVMHIENQRG